MNITHEEYVLSLLGLLGILLCILVCAITIHCSSKQLLLEFEIVTLEYYVMIFMFLLFYYVFYLCYLITGDRRNKCISYPATYVQYV